MIKCIILDLDGTLVNTEALASLRSERRWKDLPKHIHLCSPYNDALGVLNTARAVGINVALFTDSPLTYAQNLLKHFGIKIDFIVAYNDVRQHKPHSEGVEKILDHFGIEHNEAVFLGDSDLDKGAAASAGVKFFAVDWGSVSDFDSAHIGAAELSTFIGSRIRKQSSGYRSGIQQSENKFFLGYYLDGIKQEIWSFKSGLNDAVERWTKKAMEVAPTLPSVDIVIRALGHTELQVGEADSEKPLDHLAASLAGLLGAVYKPSSLHKSKVLVKSTKINATERRDQVRGVYSIDSHIVGAPSKSRLTFLVVDDVLTSGATTNEITRAVSATYPNASIYIFTLAKTLYRTEIKTESTEGQHNVQLYSDLYNPLTVIKEPVAEQLVAFTTDFVKKRNIVSKEFTANYSRTNHNFVVYNLKSYSISSEPSSRSIFTALQIIKNMLQRGKPTIASRKLRDAFGIPLANSGLDTPSQALISIKPVKWWRLIRGNKKTNKCPAKRFLEDLLPKYLGDYEFIKQLIVPEVQIFDMTQVYVNQFQNRQVDFFIPHVGLIIEIDGPQHAESGKIDAMRDTITETLGLKTVRFTTEEVSSENNGFLRKIEEILSYIKRIDHLEKEGVLNPPNGITLNDYQHAYNDGINSSDTRVRLTAAIRFQLLLLELLERGVLRLGEKSKLTLVNRDRIDFALVALEDLNEILSNLLSLMGVANQNIDIEVDEKFELPTHRTGTELIIDFSIYERYDDSFQTNHDVIYSRTHYLDFYRYFSDGDAISIETSTLVDYDFFKLSCTEPITYNLDLSPDSKQRDSLRYFLSNLFLPFLEDVDFREGQVGIIGSALSRQGTIGLLPTGSGKSICYQLSAVLQPAVSFVVCPIKSLMYDQKTDLDCIGFTRSNFITSDLKPDEKAKVQSDFGSGKYYFVFISPERFQTHGFRREMTAIGLDHAFAYAVIDEAHCLSEWGHDFRTSYLNLANTIKKLAPAASYIGLTATASVNVLKDMQTEFNIPDDYVRTPLDFTREELSFHVIDDKGRKTDTALHLVAEMEAKWNADPETPPKAGIIFTPTVNGPKGCYELAGRLASELDMDVRFFSGSPPKWGRIQGQAFDTYKRQVQEDFKLDKYRLLTATKAFGMGVNKGNIAYTVHFGIPGSMEALYQEAGRAGRDKKLFRVSPADCYVLLTKEANSGLLDKIWDSSTTVAELKAHVKALNRESDVNTNLFLMTNSIDTINDEFKLITSIYSNLEKYADQQSITLTASQFGSDKYKFEKAIYRLSQLGVVLDWVIEDFFNGTLQIEFEFLGEEQLTENIERTIRKYEPNFELSDIFASDNQHYKWICEHFNNGSINKTKFVFLVLLLWSYDHFAYNRRQSLKTVYEQCSELAIGKIGKKEFKDRLEGYFKFDESSHMIHHLAENSMDVSTWLKVFFEKTEENGTHQIISKNGLITLKEQLSRFLESYKNNICLNYLSGVIRLMSDQFDDADGERRMSSSLDHLISQDLAAARVLIKETLRLKPLFSTDAQSRFAKLAHEKLPDSSLLETINEEFGDAYSYHKLLVPLALRLEKLTNFYKGIEW